MDDPLDTPPVRVLNPNGRHPCVLVCEHASHTIPPAYGTLGLPDAALTSHIAWDPGAFDTAREMSALLDAPLVYGTVSRLVYDCNRPPEAASAMPAQSEDTVIPGNLDLTPDARAARTRSVYEPFEQRLSEVLSRRALPPVLATVHSFTPTFLGTPRDVEIGILHDRDARLADAMLARVDGFTCRRNAPYGPDDGVTHTLRRHALPRGLLNVMIEIRNDLIASAEPCQRMAKLLAIWLSHSISDALAAPAQVGRL
ncbi:MAG: N-formylglutamate amidohydrolase [Pseudomonadota bacterium]